MEYYKHSVNGGSKAESDGEEKYEYAGASFLTSSLYTWLVFDEENLVLEVLNQKTTTA